MRSHSRRGWRDAARPEERAGSLLACVPDGLAARERGSDDELTRVGNPPGGLAVVVRLRLRADVLVDVFLAVDRVLRVPVPGRPHDGLAEAGARLPTLGGHALHQAGAGEVRADPRAPPDNCVG